VICAISSPASRLHEAIHQGPRFLPSLARPSKAACFTLGCLTECCVYAARGCALFVAMVAGCDIIAFGGQREDSTRCWRA